MLGRLPFKQVWVVDFEFCQPDGDLPDPLCVVARELVSGSRVARWIDAGDPGPAPYELGPQSVFVAHNAAAECLCHLMLGWPLPSYVLDTWASYRTLKNGRSTAFKAGLLDAAAAYGIHTLSTAAKEAGRAIAMQGRAYAETQKDRLIRYCQTDVDTNADLLLAILPEILEQERGLAHAVIHGEYTKALASVEREGVPIDHELYQRIVANWREIRARLIEASDTGVTDCYVDGRFSKKRFAALIESLGLADYWPRTEKSGAFSTEEEIFRKWSHSHPKLCSLFELHETLGKIKKFSLPTGKDGRHRAGGLFPFGTKTGRNAPKSFIFAPAVWVRHLIKPAPGECVVYSDYSSQEVYVAAYKSGDPHLIAIAESGDCYTNHAIECGIAPPHATKQTHGVERDTLYKPALLSQFYGSYAEGLARRLGVTSDYAHHRMVLPHQRMYKVYWQWITDFVYGASERGFARTGYGWRMQLTGDTDWKTMLNWPIQSAGADILRFAVIGMVRNGIRVAAPIHDAVLTVCREDEVDEHVEAVNRIMRKAAWIAIGREIPVDSKVIRYPGRYTDKRGIKMFETIQKLLVGIEAENSANPSG
jgi:DNA polymerase-1